MANVIMPLLDTDEVRQILEIAFDVYDEDGEPAKLDLCMSMVNDGSIKSFIYDTFDTWAFENYWDIVEQAVRDWAYDVVSKSDNAGRE